MKYDYVIVGSGLGGAALASFLKEGKRIAIIEAGGESGNSKAVTHTASGLDFRWPVTRSIELGGTSNLWHGVLSPLDDIDFKKRDWIPHSGWPISRTDLDPFYKKAGDFLHLNNFSLYDKKTAEERYSTELATVKTAKKFVHKFFQQPVPPFRFKPILQSLKNKVDFFLNTVALELIPDEHQKEVTDRIKCYSIEKKEFIYIRGSVFIVAAGALESPRLLLNSSGCSFSNNKNIGKYLMDHPMGNFMQIKFKKPLETSIYSDTISSTKNKIKVGLVPSDEVQESDKFPNHNFFLRPSFRKGINKKAELVKLSLLAVRNNKVSLKDIYNILTNLNLARQILVYKLSMKVKYRYADLFLMTEQVPFVGSYVGLSNIKDDYGYPKADVHWKLCEYDEKNMLGFIEYVYKNCFDSNDVEFTVNPKEIDWLEVFTSAAHHVGTARMADNAEDGVVDKNLKIFNNTNTYVCDGSVFTTSGNVNSGFTIVALGVRLAEYLNNQHD